MLDLTGFRCQITVDNLVDIPENLAITLGDIILSIAVLLERSALFGGDDRGIPSSRVTRTKGAIKRIPLAEILRGSTFKVGKQGHTIPQKGTRPETPRTRRS